MLDLAPRGREVGVPALGHLAASQLHRALVERGLQLQQHHLLLDIQHRGHEAQTVAPRIACTSTQSGPRRRLCGCGCAGAAGLYPAAANVRPIHLHDAPPVQAAPARQDGARQHHAGVLPRGEDRRARLQRRRQVDAAADHGGGRPGVPRRSRARAGGDRGHARAGAAPRREQGRQGQRRGWRRGDQGAARPLQRAGRQLLRGDRRGVRQDPGEDRRGRRVEPRHAARIRDGRPAPAPAGRRREQALRRRAPARGAVPPAAARARSAAAGRAHQPPRRRVGGVAGAAPLRVQGRDRGGHPRPLLPRQRRRLDPRARPRQGHPLRRQLLQLARAEAGPARPGRARGEGP